MNPEVEIKFVVADLTALQTKLRAAGFHEQTPRTHEMNTLYDFPDGALRRRGEALRMRKYGGQWTVTHKTKSDVGRHKTRLETETSVADGERLAEIFAAMGLVASFRYEKFRAIWSDGTGHVMVDEAPIGTIAEIEGPPHWIDETAAKLGISPAEYSTQTYAEMFLDWKRRTESNAVEMTWAAIQGR